MSLLCSVEVANLNKCNIFLEILNLVHEKLMNKIAGHGGGTITHTTVVWNSITYYLQDQGSKASRIRSMDRNLFNPKVNL